MQMDKLPDSRFKLLCPNAALPAFSQVFPEPLHAMSRQFAVGGQNELLIRRMNITKPHTSPFRGARQTRERPLQRERDSPERHIEDLRNLPVAKTFGPQNQATPVLFRQRRQHGQHARSPLPAGHLVFRARVGVRRQIRQRRGVVRRLLESNASLLPPFQCVVVGHPERPRAEIYARFSLLQMPQQCQEHLLHNVLSVVNRQTEADYVPQQPVAQLIEKPDHLLGQRRSSRVPPRFDRARQR